MFGKLANIFRGTVSKKANQAITQNTSKASQALRHNVDEGARNWLAGTFNLDKNQLSQALKDNAANVRWLREKGATNRTKLNDLAKQGLVLNDVRGRNVLNLDTGNQLLDVSDIDDVFNKASLGQGTTLKGNKEIQIQIEAFKAGFAPTSKKSKQLLSSNEHAFKTAQRWRREANKFKNSKDAGQAQVAEIKFALSNALEDRINQNLDNYVGAEAIRSELLEGMRKSGFDPKEIEKIAQLPADKLNISTLRQEMAPYAWANDIVERLDTLKRPYGSGESSGINSFLAAVPGLQKGLRGVENKTTKLLGGIQMDAGTGNLMRNRAVQAGLGGAGLLGGLTLAGGIMANRGTGQAQQNPQNLNPAQQAMMSDMGDMGIPVSQQLLANAQMKAQGLSPQGGSLLGSMGSGEARWNPFSETALLDAFDRAMAANDYESAYMIYQQLQNAPQASTGGTSELSAGQQTKIAEAVNGLDMLDELEAKFNAAGGARGVLGGTFQNIFGGLNSDSRLYNDTKNLMGMALMKSFVNMGATEQDAKRYVDQLPKYTDTPETAQAKIDMLRQIINKSIQNIQTVGGAGNSGVEPIAQTTL
jgi:hypothetical protein